MHPKDHLVALPAMSRATSHCPRLLQPGHGHSQGWEFHHSSGIKQHPKPPACPGGSRGTWSSFANKPFPQEAESVFHSCRYLKAIDDKEKQYNECFNTFLETR